MWTGQRRATRGFLLVSAAALTVPAVIVGWLGWLLLQSDRELDRQRVQERLTNAAILAIASLEQAISATEQRLTALASAESPVRPPEGFESLLEADAALVVISATEIWSSAPLLYYPGEIDFTDSVADAFVAGERLEFAQKDLASALDSYRALADSRDRAVRAGALGRMARVARKLDRPKMALEAYDALAPLGSTMVLGRPADLVASLERCAVLQEMNEHDRLAREARQFDCRLTSADWRLSASQFHFYRGLVDEWLDDSPGEAENSTARAREAIAAGVLALRRDSPEVGAASGRQTFSAGPSRGVILWRRSGERLAALIAAPPYIDRVWFQGLRAIESDQNVHISLTGPDGHEWFHAGVAGDALRRTASDTGLPFTLRVASSDPARDTATFTERRRLITGMVSGLGLLVVAGGYVTARGLARELAAARLQSDFVAAVSHEFRTPVASVRQLSELLDEGRVPDESRRSEYDGLLRRESVRLQHLVEPLDFGRMESAAAEYRLAPVARHDAPRAHPGLRR